MFWPSDESDLETAAASLLVQFGMKHYVYTPLNVDMPTNKKKYTQDAILTYKIVTLKQMQVLKKDFVKFIHKNTTVCSADPSTTQHGAHHRAVIENNNNTNNNKCVDNENNMTTFYSKIVETLASNKLTVENVVDTDGINDIDALPEVDMRQLKYSSKTIKALHKLTFKMMVDNQTGTYSVLRKFMAMCVRGDDDNDREEDPHVRHKNLYLCSFVHSCAKTCKQSLSMRLVMFYKPLRAGRLCMYSEGRSLVELLSDKLVVKACPKCYKPVNIAIKKKLAAGGAHKSQLFTDEYTNEILYCTEKNNRGILQFPMLSVHPINGGYFVNKLIWRVNSASTYEIYLEDIMVGAGAGLKMTVVDTARGRSLVVNPMEFPAGRFCGAANDKESVSGEDDEDDMEDGGTEDDLRCCWCCSDKEKVLTV